MITFDNPVKKSPLPPVVKTSQVAQLLSVSPRTVHNLIESGALKAASLNPTSKRRKHVQVTRASLLALYKKRFGHCLLDALANPFQP